MKTTSVVCPRGTTVKSSPDPPSVFDEKDLEVARHDPRYDLLEDLVLDAVLLQVTGQVFNVLLGRRLVPAWDRVCLVALLPLVVGVLGRIAAAVPLLRLTRALPLDLDRSRTARRLRLIVSLRWRSTPLGSPSSRRRVTTSGNILLASASSFQSKADSSLKTVAACLLLVTPKISSRSAGNSTSHPYQRSRGSYWIVHDRSSMSSRPARRTDTPMFSGASLP